MKTRSLSSNQPSQKTIVFTGGINESLSNLEMKPGECFDMDNYEEISGEFHGYRSTMGFERIDGTTENIENPNKPGEFIDVSYPSDVPLVFTDPDDYSQIDDTAREARRANIVEPTLNNGGYLKGAFDFDGQYFVVAYENIAGDHLLFQMTSLGWVEVTSFPVITEGAGIDAGFNYHIEIGRMQHFPFIADGATPNSTIAVLCNGISPPILLYKTDLGAYACVSLVESNGDDYQGQSFLPCDPSNEDPAYPYRSVIYNQRLHLAFPYGTLAVSHVGDPFQFDSSVRSAGAFYLGAEITDFVVGPSSLQVFMDKGIDIIRPSDPDLNTGFDEIKETFSPLSGAKANTAQRMFGRTIYCDDRGITSLEATDTYGDFNITNLSLKAQRTYQRNKNIIAGTAIDREKNQYIVYFQNGEGLTVTLEINYRGDFQVRGITPFTLGKQVNSVWGVRKESKRLLTTTADAFLRLQHESAACFDGAVIVSKFTTSFHTYNNDVNWKTFLRLLFELTATKGQVFSIRPIFDYRDSQTPKAVVYETDPTKDNGIWGTGIWGQFVWGGTGAVNQEYSYIRGIGVNMAIQFTCSSKYHTPHTVQNAIVLYQHGQIAF